MDWSCLSQIPPRPGVYVFKDVEGTIMYVGMATNLHNRLRTYARGKSRDPREQAKLNEIRSQAVTLEHVIAENELGAKIMEDYLIYYLRPRLNGVMLPIRYNFLKVTVTETYPRLVHTKDLQSDGSAYFGPFYSFTHSKDVLADLRRLFKIRNCDDPDPSDVTSKIYGKPCADFELGHCVGPCREGASTLTLQQQYRQCVGQLLQVLGGDIAPLEVTLAQKMEKAAAEMDYETAAFYKQKRDRLVQALNRRKMQFAGDADLATIRQQVAKYVPLTDLNAGKLPNSSGNPTSGYSRWA